MASLVETMQMLTAKLDKLGAIASNKGVTAAEGLKGLNWTTQMQAQMHKAIGADATRGIKAGSELAGSGLGLLNQMTGGQGITGVADKAIKSDAMGGLKSAGGAVSDIGGKLMATGNPYAAAAGGAMKFAGAIAEIPAQIKEWGDHLHEQNRQFSQYSAGMAAVMAVDDARRMQLEKEQGDRRSASARELSDARYRLDAAMAPLEDAFADFKNSIVANLMDTLTAFAQGLKDLFPNMDWGQKKPEVTGSFDPDIDKREEEIRKRRPRHMR